MMSKQGCVQQAKSELAGYHTAFIKVDLFSYFCAQSSHDFEDQENKI